MCVRNHNKDDHSSESGDEEDFRGRVVDDKLADEDEDMKQDDESKDDRRRHHKRCHCTKLSPTCFFETYDLFAMESNPYLRNDREGMYHRKLSEYS